MTDARQHAFQIVSKALHYDTQRIYQEAFERYLESIHALSEYLYSKVKTEGVPCSKPDVQDTQKILSVTQQCLERLQKLLNEGKLTNFPKYDSLWEHQRSLQENQMKDTNSVCELDQTHLLNVPNVSSLSWSPVAKRKEALGNQPAQEWAINFHLTRKKLTPLQQAERENGILRKVFERRIQQETNPQKCTNLKLELQRRIMENLALAEAKNRKYQKKLKEKEELALLKAQKKFIIPEKLPENDERRQLIGKIIQYEQNEEWPSVLKKELQSRCNNPEIIQKIISQTLSSYDHPLKLWIVNMQLWLKQRMQSICQWNVTLIQSLPGDLLLEKRDIKVPSETHRSNLGSNKANPSCEVKGGVSVGSRNGQATAGPHKSTSNDQHNESSTSLCERTLDVNTLEEDLMKVSCLELRFRNKIDNIVEDVSLCIEIIIQVLCLTYEPLAKEEHQSFVYRTVEKHFLGPLWDILVVMFRLSNFQSEHRLGQAMCLFQQCPPEDLGIKSDQALDSPLLQECVRCLRGVIHQRSLIAKIESFVHVIHRLCDFSEEGAESLFGADDLIPLLSYTLVKSSLPQLVSECDALDHMIDPRYLKGEEGYSLTSVQMALKYLETVVG